MSILVEIWRSLTTKAAVVFLFLSASKLDRPGEIIRKLHLKWKVLSHIKRSIAFGISIALVTVTFQDAEVFQKMENVALDWMIKMYRGVPRTAKADLHPVTFLDIDERSYRHWGEPLSVPRDKLLKLIKYAVDGKASIVIVDVELSRSMGAHDMALKEYLASYSELNLKPPEILLARGLRLPLELEQGLIEQRPSFLDEVVAKNSHLHWAAPLYQMDEDAVIRRWRLWEFTCVTDSISGERNVVGLPSFQLLATALLKEKKSESTLQEVISTQLPENCNSIAINKEKEIKGGVIFDTLKFNQDDLGRRILYSIPLKLHDGETYQKFNWKNNKKYPLFSSKPAVVVTEVINQPAPDLSGHVVVIGSSYSDSRDIYSTPLGSMPGTMIIANSYLSFLQNGEATSPPKWLKLIIELICIVVAAFVFSKLSGILAKVVASVVILILLLPISFFLFRSGVWLDFAIPLAAVEIHAMISEAEEKLDKNYSD